MGSPQYIQILTMTSTTQAIKNAITLKGSSTIICEYLSKWEFRFWLKTGDCQLLTLVLLMVTIPDYGINAILFQRGIYPAETFNTTQHYGLTLLMSKDDKIEAFLKNVLSQAEGLHSPAFLHLLSLTISSELQNGSPPTRWRRYRWS